MAANTLPIYPDTINVGHKKFTNSDSTTLSAIVTAGTDGTRVDEIIVTSTSASDIDVQVWINDGSDDYLLGTVEIPAGAGNTSSVRSVAVFVDGNFSDNLVNTGSLYVPSGSSVRMNLKTALASGEYMYVTAMGGDY